MTVDFNPVIFDLGPLQVRWYGMMYVVGFIIGTILLRHLSDKGLFKLAKDKIDSLATYLILGMFLGARIFYVFVYNWSDYASSPMDIFAVWKGGLSFHGAIIGMTIGCILFAKRNKVHPMHVADAAVTVGAQGLFFGRLGNFINGELYGRLTDVPWGMIFPSGGPFPRHPSQLYEAICEGLILFLILWFWRKRMKHVGVQSSIFLIGYGVMRFGIEFFREADSQLGYYLGGTITMGQILCFLMMAIGGSMLFYFSRKKITA